MVYSVAPAHTGAVPWASRPYLLGAPPPRPGLAHRREALGQLPASQRGDWRPGCLPEALLGEDGSSSNRETRPRAPGRAPAASPGQGPARGLGLPVPPRGRPRGFCLARPGHATAFSLAPRRPCSNRPSGRLLPWPGPGVGAARPAGFIMADFLRRQGVFGAWPGSGMGAGSALPSHDGALGQLLDDPPPQGGQVAKRARPRSSTRAPWARDSQASNRPLRPAARRARSAGPGGTGRPGCPPPARR